MKIILDTNIYDFLAVDDATCALVRAMVETGELAVIVTPTIAEELLASPFEGIPNFFKIEYEGGTVSRCGIMCTGDRLGGGEVFDAHLGKSKNIHDALIADAAATYVDWIVSEDRRLSKRLCDLDVPCLSITYEEFKARLRKRSEN